MSWNKISTVMFATVHPPAFVFVLQHHNNVKSSAKELLWEGGVPPWHIYSYSHNEHTLTETMLPYLFYPTTLKALCHQFPKTTSKIQSDNISRISPFPLLLPPQTPPSLSVLADSKQPAWFLVLWLVTPPSKDRKMENGVEIAENQT